MSSIPEGFELVEESAPLTPANPVNIPEGFELVEAEETEELKPDYTGASIIEPARTVGSSMAHMVSGGLTGLAEAVLTGDPKMGALAVDSFQKRIFQPETKAGREGLQSLADNVQWVIDQINVPVSHMAAMVELVAQQGPEQALATLANVRTKGLGQTMGDRIMQETGSPEAATLARITPDAILEIMGLKGAMMFTRQSPTKQKIAEMIEEGSTDIETAGFKLIDENSSILKQDIVPGMGKNQSGQIDSGFGAGVRRVASAGPRVEKNPFELEAIKRGLDEGVAPVIREASAADKSRMLDMVDIMEGVSKNRLYGMRNRPGDVAGNALLDQFNVIRGANRRAAKELDNVANGLRGKTVNFDQATDNFLRSLDDIGVELQVIDGKITPNYAGSLIEDLPGPQAALNRVIKRAAKGGENVDAYELHRLKKFIDEQVTYGKSAEGLGGRTESILKGLRHDIDTVLDNNFTAYNRVNSQYSETIDIIDGLQTSVGKRIDLTSKSADKALGTELRKVMSNQKSRVEFMDLLDEIDGAARSYAPGRFDDLDLMSLALFADELDSMFKPVGRTSLQGQFNQTMERFARESSDTRGYVRRKAGESIDKAARKIWGSEEELAFKALRDLLNSGMVQ